MAIFVIYLLILLIQSTIMLVCFLGLIWRRRLQRRIGEEARNIVARVAVVSVRECIPVVRAPEKRLQRMIWLVILKCLCKEILFVWRSLLCFESRVL